MMDRAHQFLFNGICLWNGFGESGFRVFKKFFSVHGRYVSYIAQR